MKHIVMFSSGMGSALAAKRVADEVGTDNLVLLFADVNGEHPDNYRFLHEAAQWIGGQLVILDNDGKTIWQTFKDKRFLGNARVDVCSRMLKREPMLRWVEANCKPEDTVIYLGFDWSESHRLDRAAPRWLPWTVKAPMCEPPYLDKTEMQAVMKQAGIEPPLLTRLGFPHANCGGGCVKAGMAHFNLLLEKLPEEYAKWEEKEEEMRVFLGKDIAILRDRSGKGKARPLTLKQLRERGAQPSQDWGQCGCLSDD